MNNLIKNSSPIFIVGMNGSGTTMLVDCLGRHHEIYGFPLETRVMPDYLSNVKKYGDLNSDENFLKLFNQIRKLPVFQMINDSKPVPLPEDWSETGREVSLIFDKIFRYFAHQQGKARWCEKTPQHVQNIDLLASAYDKAKFIHIIRDGRDCAASFQRRWKRTPELTIFRWKNVVRRGRIQGNNLGDRYIEIKYEDLTSNPKFWMQRICEFLEVEFDKNVLVSRRPQSENFGTMGEIEKNVEKWKTTLSLKSRQSLESIAGEMLFELDYPIEFVKGNKKPTDRQLALWKAKDYSRQFVNEIYRKLSGKSKKNWRMLLYLPISAIKQLRSNKY